MSSKRNSYVLDTSPKPYDQLIVLSQKIINQGFKNMWKIAQEDPESYLNHFHFPLHGEDLEADVGIPSVQLHVESKEPMLYFRLALTKGTLKVYESMTSEDLLTFDIKDWILTFNVVVNQKQLSKDSDEYKQFKKRAGLSESNFSLAQLFVDASSSTRLNEDLTSLGDITLSDLSADQRGSVVLFITRWITNMSERGESILGFAAQRDDSSGSERSEGTNSNKDGQDANALSYLLTSDFKAPPAEGAIPYTGPWVDAESRLGTFCMSRDLLWPWMLPVLKQVVLAMTPVPDKPYAAWTGTPEDMPYETGYRYHVGESSPDGADYQWNVDQVDPARWNITATRKETSATAYMPGRPSDNMTAYEAVDYVEASVVYEIGMERLNVKGSSVFNYHLYHDRTDYDPTSFTTVDWINWSITLDMASIEEGGLIWISDQNDIYLDVRHNEDGDMKMGKTAEELASSIAEGLQNSLALALERETETLVEALANANRLCLPGAGSFFMKDPIFNENGDLLVKLEYDGADPPPPPRKGKYRLPGRGIKASVGRGDSLPQSEISRIRKLAQQKN
ncbi:hypothetical protein BDW72DRAFT_210416 [Aspergillus terricola var. indicus]